MKFFLIFLFLLSIKVNAIGQEHLKDSAGGKEHVAVAELGGAANWNPGNGVLSFGPSAAIEFTPIANWLELELGISPTYGKHLNEWDVDILFKKPWDISRDVEFMLGVGLAWNHENDKSVATNSVAGEIALDFMFWPSARHRFGWFIEPGYEYSFKQGHEQSLVASGGLLVGIP